MQYFKIMLVGSDEQLKDVKISKYTTNNTLAIHRTTKELKTIVKNLTTCNLVVTMDTNDWDEKLLRIIQIARLLDIQVIHHSRFNDYVQTVNN